MEVPENAALRRKPIEVGSDEAFRAKDADVGVALIVSEDDDDVRELGAFSGGCEGGGVQQRCKEQRVDEKGAQGLQGQKGRQSGILHVDIADGFWWINQEREKDSITVNGRR
jgi:hypothetical protein